MKPKMVSVSAFCQYVGVGKTTAFRLIRLKEVEVARIGRRTLVSLESADRLIERCTSLLGGA